MSDDLDMRLTMATVASCECLTKTPEPELHEERCRYRVLRDAQTELASLRQRVAEMTRALEWAAGQPSDINDSPYCVWCSALYGQAHDADCQIGAALASGGSKEGEGK